MAEGVGSGAGSKCANFARSLAEIGLGEGCFSWGFVGLAGGGMTLFFFGLEGVRGLFSLSVEAEESFSNITGSLTRPFSNVSKVVVVVVAVRVTVVSKATSSEEVANPCQPFMRF